MAPGNSDAAHDWLIICVSLTPSVDLAGYSLFVQQMSTAAIAMMNFMLCSGDGFCGRACIEAKQPTTGNSLRGGTPELLKRSQCIERMKA